MLSEKPPVYNPAQHETGDEPDSPTRYNPREGDYDHTAAPLEGKITEIRGRLEHNAPDRLREYLEDDDRMDAKYPPSSVPKH